MLMRRIGTLLTALVLGVGTAAVVAASPAHAEPQPCSGRSSDSGTGGQWNIGGQNYTIWGVWYNCGGTWGQTDYVAIDVANSVDGPCMAVPYGSSSSVQFNRGPYFPFAPDPYFRGWYWC